MGRENPERAKERVRQWRIDNPERHRALGRVYYWRHREAELEKMRARQQTPVGKRQRRENERRRRERLAGAGDGGLLATTYVLMLADDPCSYCGLRGSITTDHIVPISRDGDGAWDNLTAACGSCNRRKHAQSLLEFLL